MKKWIAALSFLFAVSAHSQINHYLSIGPDLGMPVDGFGEASSALGASLQYQVKFKGPVGAQLHVGYNRFPALKELFSDYKVKLIPIRAGIIGYFYKDQGFVSLDAGLLRTETKVVDRSGFTLSIGLGYRQYLDKRKQHFLQLSPYFNFSDLEDDIQYKWFSLRLAYGFAAGKK